jgi:hypothetical protein
VQHSSPPDALRGLFKSADEVSLSAQSAGDNVGGLTPSANKDLFRARHSADMATNKLMLCRFILVEARGELLCAAMRGSMSFFSPLSQTTEGGTMRTLFLSFVALVLAACGPTAGDAADGGGGGGGGDGGGTGGHVDASCGEQTTPIELVEAKTPDLLIVLDRSGSMSGSISLFGPSKWSIMKDALTSITNSFQADIRFGLSAFPNDEACGVGSVPDVALDLNNKDSIVTFMQDNGPLGSTPAHPALQAALTTFQGLPPNPGGQYVLFATDGAPNCADTGDAGALTVDAVEALATAGISTYVLGFGDAFGFDSSVLNDAALAGGVPKDNGPPYYYHAQDATALQDALDTIAQGILKPSCSFEITEDPPDPDLVTVKLGDSAVPRDPNHQDGWDYDPDNPGFITFYGGYCDSIESGNAGEASFVFGCPGPQIE